MQNQPTKMGDEESDSRCSCVRRVTRLPEKGEQKPRRDRVGREETPRARDEEGENFKREREEHVCVCVCVYGCEAREKRTGSERW